MTASLSKSARLAVLPEDWASTLSKAVLFTVPGSHFDGPTLFRWAGKSEKCLRIADRLISGENLREKKNPCRTSLEFGNIAAARAAAWRRSPAVCSIWPPAFHSPTMPMKSIPSLRLILSLLLGLTWLAWTDQLVASPAAGKPDKAKRAAKKDLPAAEKRAVTKPNRPDPLALQPPKPKSPQEQLQQVNVQALRLAIADLQTTFGERYTKAAEFLEQLERCERRKQELEEALAAQDSGAASKVSALLQDFRQLQQAALLANPLLDFDRLLLIQRSLTSPKLGLPQNWQGNCALPKTGYDNGIAVLSPVRPDGSLTTLYQPADKRFVGDVDLHFDADRLLFSMPGSQDRWQIWEIRTDGTGLRQVTPARSRTWTTTTRATCPTAGSSSVRRGASTACRAWAGTTRWRTCS